MLSWLKINELFDPKSYKASTAYELESPKLVANQTPEPSKSTNPINLIAQANLINQSNNPNITTRKPTSELTNSRTIPEAESLNKAEKFEKAEAFESSFYLNSNNQSENELLKSKDILESKELFFVRNYIIKSKLMSGISSKDLKMLKKQFNKSHYAFDTNTIIDEYVFNSNKNLLCIVCKKSFASPFDVVINFECKGEYFHPRFIMNAKNEKFVCNHEGCKKRIVKGDFPCCHKGIQSAGCLLGDGKHHLVLVDNNIASVNTSF